MTRDGVVKVAKDELERRGKKQLMRAGAFSRNGTAPTADHFTDLGNAGRLVATHGKDLRYCHLSAKWFVWDGQRYRPDDTGEVMRRAKDVIRGLWDETIAMDYSEEKRHMVNWALKSEAHGRLVSMVRCATSEPGIPILQRQLDADPWLLNVENGTLNLQNSKLQPHRRRDYITKLAPVVYDPKAKSPLWDAFLDKVMAGNDRLIEFLQRLVGYSLTGNTSEQILTVLLGSGANGKSTLLETVRAVAGDYRKTAPPALLLMSRGDRHPTELADLAGARFVSTVEVGEGRRLAEELAKRLTGGDTVKARRMREDFWEFTPTHKLWLAANFKPEIRGTDWAIWRRILLIPFNVVIPLKEQDKYLLDKLKEELPGILAWAVRGCQAWQKEGLQIPQEVQRAVKEYRAESDIVGQFIRECCIKGPGHREKSSRLYMTFQAWAKHNAERTMSQKAFGTRLSQHGFETRRSGIHYWLGLKLRPVKVMRS
jgi:putative DNA primase/helicase